MSTGDRPFIAIGALEIRYLLDGTVTGAGMGVFELTVPPGAKSPPAHSHDNAEFVYGLEGVMRCIVGGETRMLAAGDTSYTPPGVVHAFGNPYEQTARMLVANSPDIGAHYFRDIAAALADGPDLAKMTAVMRHYGLTPVA